MNRFSAVLAVALLAGCAPDVSSWHDPKPPKTVKVEMVRLDHAVTVAPGAATPSATEFDRLAAFLARSQARAGDRVLVETPNSVQAAGVVSMLRKRGLEVATASAPALRVRLEQWVATPPPCPDWSKQTARDYENELPSNFGCATASNLGLMIADPRDLVLGRDPGPSDAEPGILAQQRYRQGKGTKLPGESGGLSPSIVINNGASGGGGGEQ